jgi:hypothetical protein
MTKFAAMTGHLASCTTGGVPDVTVFRKKGVQEGAISIGRSAGLKWTIGPIGLTTR